ncbi:ABC transporter permease [Thomasclavelia sp.]|uniref:ABC transporter permease n=1 Tax=Thomasclavelia sp. TaxID=3025757 RepID=UPI0025D37B8B|nr:ABC transporter permease [Thomasclavelia sp.]
MDKAMVKYIAKRLAISIATLFVILTVLFIMIRSLPGTPFNSEKMTEAQLAVANAKYGFDKPLLVQYVMYLKDMVMGDFGISFALYKNISVASLVGNAAKISFIYGIVACALGTIVGMILGVVAALKKNTIWDTLTTTISVLGVSIPSFVFALLLVMFFAYKLRILPLQYNSNNPIFSSILPILALSMSVIANVARFTRTEMISVLNSEYITLAKAKGLDGKTMILKHALRNGLIPVITILGPILVNLMTGTMVIEQICGVPGLGKLLINGIAANDYNIVLACAFLYAVMYVVIVFVIDVSYGLIDPRIRIGKG